MAALLIRICELNLDCTFCGSSWLLYGLPLNAQMLDSVYTFYITGVSPLGLIPRSNIEFVRALFTFCEPSKGKYRRQMVAYPTSPPSGVEVRSFVPHSSPPSAFGTQ